MSYFIFFESLVSLIFTTSDQTKTCIPDHLKAFAQYKTSSSGFVCLVFGGLVVFFLFHFR